MNCVWFVVIDCGVVSRWPPETRRAHMPNPHRRAATRTRRSGVEVAVAPVDGSRKTGSGNRPGVRGLSGIAPRRA
jgi:hypothetical protein